MKVHNGSDNNRIFQLKIASGCLHTDWNHTSSVVQGLSLRCVLPPAAIFTDRRGLTDE